MKISREMFKNFSSHAHLEMFLMRRGIGNLYTSPRPANINDYTVYLITNKQDMVRAFLMPCAVCYFVLTKYLDPL